MIQNAAIAEKWLKTIPHIKNLVQSQAELEPSLYLDINWVSFDYKIHYIIMAHTKNLNWRTTHRKYLIRTFVCMCVKTLRSLNIENYYVWTYWLCPIKCYLFWFYLSLITLYFFTQLIFPYILVFIFYYYIYTYIAF